MKAQREIDDETEKNNWLTQSTQGTQGFHFMPSLKMALAEGRLVPQQQV